MEILKLGQYKIPDGMVATLNKGILTIREPKVKPFTGKRCKECRFLGSGKATDSNSWTTCICLKKPKHLKHQKTQGQIYFYANPASKACEMFKDKEEE